MRLLNKYFINKKIDYNKLCNSGFKKEGNIYRYVQKLKAGNFKIIVEINDEIKQSKIIDLNTLEEYILADIDSSNGNYVGAIKTEYEDIIKQIVKECTINNIHKTVDAKKIINYITKRYESKLEYLWEKYPNYAIARNHKNNKWYMLIGSVSKEKLGINSADEVEIINLKYQKNKTIDIIDNKYIFPGYHMNKNSWITIILDSGIPIDKIFELIDNSYQLSL